MACNMLTQFSHHKSNLLFTGILLALLVSFSSCSKDDSTTNNNRDGIVPSPSYDSAMPIGFGANTTGGNNQNVIVVSAAEELRDGIVISTVRLSDAGGEKDVLSVVRAFALAMYTQGDRQQFVRTYSYNAFDASLVANVVGKSRYGAGATLKIKW